MGVKFKNVLIALDDSDLSKKAFHRAVHIAKRDDSELFLTHIIETSDHRKANYHPLIKNYMGINERILEQSKNLL